MMKSLFFILLVFVTTETFAIQICQASWYGGKFHGRKTASGAIFNVHTNMAAHRTLKFGTKVLVTNLTNGKSTKVIILDRGPFAKTGKRCIDLSEASKSAIGMRGTAPVSLEVVK